MTDREVKKRAKTRQLIRNTTLNKIVKVLDPKTKLPYENEWGARLGDEYCTSLPEQREKMIANIIDDMNYKLNELKTKTL